MSQNRSSTSWHPRRTEVSATVLVVVWFAAAAYGWIHLDRGWVPHDEGAFAQSAERVLSGEIPHRDYDEIYTGGLTYANALAFRLFGVRLIALRYMLYLAYLAWLPAVFYIATRFVSPWLAGLVTLLAASWSIPNYPAAVPSWYILFLATFTIGAMLRFHESRRSRWIVTVGALLGLSILVKIVGLYLLLGALVWFSHLEQTQGADQHQGAESGRGYSVLLTIAASMLVVLLVALIASYPGPSQYAQFVLPGSALLAYVVWEEWRTPKPRFAIRMRQTAAWAIPLICGLAIPLVVFLLIYLKSGAVDSLLRGLFVSPLSRFRSAAVEPRPLITGLFALLPPLFLIGSFKFFAYRTRLRLMLVAMLLLMLLLISEDTPTYRAIWLSIQWSIPVLLVAGLGMLASKRARRGAETDNRSVMAFATLSVAAFLALIQFPFSAPIYFAYVAPIVFLGTAALVAQERSLQPAFALLVIFYMLFSITRITPGFIYNMGHFYRKDDQTEMLSLPRGGIRVSSTDKAIYEGLVNLIEARAGDGGIYAAPDCPEVYFLAGRSNPSRQLFDFLAGPSYHEQDVLRLLDREDVRVVVLNHNPSFSEPLSPSLFERLSTRYPVSYRLGNFEVRWMP